MRVVLDTNVLLSALISPHGWPDKIYRAWRIGKFDLITSSIQLEEVRRASRYPKFKGILQPHLVGAMVNNMQRAVLLEYLSPLPLGLEIDDPYDIFLIQMAMQSEADYLVTGDSRAGLLQRGHIGRTQIVNPAEFWSMLR